ncbi:MAG: long-chain fatty acid--CoA ligase [Chloroflexi bacterium]|nr:MAG: long-chain fatty acid--CoA ligase [Chloroflexota bacterium]
MKYGDRALAHHLQDGVWQATSWNAMRRDVLAVASGLIDAGVKVGDCVILIGENSLDWLWCDFGIQAAGAITVPIYAGSTPEVVQKIVDNSGATFAIASNPATASKVPFKNVALMPTQVAEWVGHGPTQDGEIGRRMSAIRPDDLCTIVYTSGTTGDPKGVELAHRNLVDIGRAAVEVHPINDQDRALSWLPYSHVFGRINEIFLAIIYGGQVWISRGVDHIPQELAEVQPTVMCSAPRMYEKMYAAVMARVRDTSPARRSLFNWAIGAGKRRFHAQKPGPLLRAEHRLADRLVLAPLRKRLTGGRLRFFISGGAALAREIEEFFWAIGVPILNGWGMTETSSGVCSNTLLEHRFLTVGKPFPGVEIKVADDGEILVKGPGNMLGYHKNPAATAEVLQDGWVYSGDIGKFDNDGFLKITDRKKSLFKTAGGKYVAPVPLEQGLMRNPLLLRALVIGDGKPYVTALVVPDWDDAKKQGLDEAAIRASIQKTVDELNSRLGRWETIKYFTLLDRDFTEEAGELSLKLDVKRKAVAERYRDQIEAMYAGRSEGS